MSLRAQLCCKDPLSSSEEEREEQGGKVVEHKIEGVSSHCLFISVQFMSKSTELNREFIKL